MLLGAMQANVFTATLAAIGMQYMLNSSAQAEQLALLLHTGSWH